MKRPPSTGPSTLENAKTKPEYPSQRARSRGATRSPTAASGSAFNPPAPMPWIARNTMSCVMLDAAPHKTEPVRKIPIAISIMRLRP